MRINRKPVECNLIVKPDLLACSSCKYTIAGLIQYINTNSGSITRASMSDLCAAKFADDEQTMCKGILSQYGPKILQLLAKKLGLTF